MRLTVIESEWKEKRRRFGRHRPVTRETAGAALTRRCARRAAPTAGAPLTAAACLLVVVTLCGPLGIPPAMAGVLDPDFGPPPVTDPSAFTPLNFNGEFLSGLPPANEGAFEGPGRTTVDPGTNNAVPAPGLLTNIPTNSRPSPLCFEGLCAQPWTQQMLVFEEFGTETLDNTVTPSVPFPQPTTGPPPEQDPDSVAASSPPGADLEAFLAQRGIAPFPTQFANTVDQNPWALPIDNSVISNFLGRSLVNPPAEGRPPGQGWAHQRWNEFYPQVFFKTAQAGARVNGGFRDARQMHRYQVGEFGPGGLYNTVYTSSVPGAPTLTGTTSGLAIRLHPNMPIQDHKALWTFDGTLPPKLLMARYGQAVLMRHYNALPIDPAANRGFGLHTITTHEHNGHSPAESDGYTNAFFFPGQFYDYRWPIQLAGYDTINTTATDPRAAFPCSPGETLFVHDANEGVKTCENGSIKIRGDWRETMSTHWFHDHMLDFTAQNVYKGNAVMMNYYSALDRGNEAFDDGVNLRLPSGTALPWGNRDYDVNLLVADKAWDNTGQLWFNIFNTDGFLGDQVLANWLYKPYFNVRARRYRFRILNGAVSRYFSIALVRQVNDNTGELAGPPGSNVSYNRVPFHMIANDGNVMEHAVPFDGSIDLDGDGDLLEHKGRLPTQGIAERYDIVVDFARHGIQPGDRLYFVNVMEHDDGKGTKGKVPLDNVLNETYKPELRHDDEDGVPDRWINGDPGVGKFLELRVQAHSGGDPSMDPTAFEPGGRTMIPLPIHRDDPADQAKLAQARRRTFEFKTGAATDNVPWVIKTDGGAEFGMDPRRISAAPQLTNGPEGTLEIWHIQSGGGWDHPVHVHFEEGVILTRGGIAPPLWEKWARKDMYRVGGDEDGTNSVEMAIRIRDFAGTYVEHCHNTQHEDHAMLLRWDAEHPGQIELMPTPLPTWDGVEYVDSAALPTFRDRDPMGPTPIEVALSGLPVSPVTTGTPVLFAATATGGFGSFEYEFQGSADGVNFIITRDFSSDNTWSWGTAVGSYTFRVRVRNAGNPGSAVTSAPVSYVVTEPAVTPITASLSGSLASPVTTGTPVLFTATASGGSGVFEYEFQGSADGVNFIITRDFSSDNTWSWGTAVGSYTFRVRVRNAGNPGSAVTSAPVSYVVVERVSSPTVTASLSGSPASPPAAGTPVLFTATASGGSGVFEYEFQGSADGVNFIITRDFSSDNTWSWGTAPGNYFFVVNVRDAGTSSGAVTSAPVNYLIQ